MTENTVPSLFDVLAILNTAPGFYLVLTESLDDAHITDLKVSLTQVLKEKVPNYAPGNWHPGIARAGNSFNKVWKWFNNPVLKANGDVQYIIHSIENVDGKTVRARKFKRRPPVDARGASHQQLR